MTQDLSDVREARQTTMEQLPDPLLNEVDESANVILSSADPKARCVSNVHVKLLSVLALVHTIHV